MKACLRYIPSIDELQLSQKFRDMAHEQQMSYQRLTRWLQEDIEDFRQQLLQNQAPQIPASRAEATDLIFKNLQHRLTIHHRHHLRPVINGTGVILHTNLGRARLSDQAAESAYQAGRAYSNLEYDIDQGQRGSRHDIVERLLCEWSGAEAAMVVNNNAAAVFLILRAFAKNSEVIVSRGELIEIGGSFRVSSIMTESDAKLTEVGTTNKTHLKDYQEAIHEETAMLMKVHTSNFTMQGFTGSIAAESLAPLAAQHHLILYEDLGSGAFYNFSREGIGQEPNIKDVITSGVHIASMSGDKLLGGPQAGIILGQKSLIQSLKKHQLARTLRVDKMTLAALETTLHHYLQADINEIPVVRDILQTEAVIQQRAEQIKSQLDAYETSFHIDIASAESQIGGGTMPDVTLPTSGVTLSHQHLSSHSISEALRLSDPPVITRMLKGKVYIDCRTITDETAAELINVIRQAER